MPDKTHKGRSEKSVVGVAEVKEFRVAMIMPQGWRGGMLKVGIETCNMLDGLQVDGQVIRPIFSVPDTYNVKDVVGLNPDIPIIKTSYGGLDSDDPRIKGIIDTECYPFLPAQPSRFAFPYDAANAVMGADAWIIMTGFLVAGPLLPIKPYAVYAPDFIQRYVPEIFSPNIADGTWVMSANQNMTMQAARRVFATTPKTASDVTVYGGVPKSRVSLFPLFHSGETGRREGLEKRTRKVKKRTAGVSGLLAFDQANTLLKNAGHSFSEKLLEENYFLWVTNATQHKNHTNAVEALDIYYNHLGGQLNCYVCGPTTQLMGDVDHPIPYISQTARALRKVSESSGKLQVLGELPAYNFDTILSNAAFLWHNVLYDNGTFSVIEAAELNVPAVVSDYPQMRFICEQYNIHPRWFKARDTYETARALLEQEGSNKAVESVAISGKLETEMKACLTSLVQDLMRPRQDSKSPVGAN